MEILGVFLAGAAAAAAIYYAGVARNQLEEMTRQGNLITQSLNETTISNERSQRAWVLFQKYEPIPFLNTLTIKLAPEMNVRLVFRNYGKTPAQKVIILHNYTVTVSRPTTPIPLLPGGTLIGRSIAGPDAQILTDMKVSVTESDRRLIADTHRLWLYGHVAYSDPFSDDRRTEFCLFYSPTAEYFVVCNEGNTAR